MKNTGTHFLQRFMVVAVAATLVLAPVLAQARSGGGSSFGSRGGRTFSQTPSTTTAPRGAGPLERSTTAPGGVATPQPGVSRPAAPGGIGRGFMGGLLGAGLFGLLLGGGLLGGLGSIMSILGLFLQIALVLFLARLAFNWFTRRRLAPAGMPQGMMAPAAFQARNAPGSSPVQDMPLAIQPVDFDAFETLLKGVQQAYGNEDLGGLRRMATPEMASGFADEIAEYNRKGQINKVSSVTLLQGDLAEAWRERSGDYATVAMRYSLLDTVVERVSGRLISGNPNVAEEVTEIWTFRRNAGAGPQAWQLSAIQQA